MIDITTILIFFVINIIISLSVMAIALKTINEFSETQNKLNGKLIAHLEYIYKKLEVKK